MADIVGSATAPARVAVIGSGPAGFYACEEFLKQTDTTVRIDLFDRLPTPYGLVRGGVAPDHQKIKSVIRLYERTAGREGFRFFGCESEVRREVSARVMRRVIGSVERAAANPQTGTGALNVPRRTASTSV